MENTKFQYNIRIKNIEERWRLWSNKNNPVHVRVMNRRARLKGGGVRPPSPILTEVRILETSQEWISKPIPTSRDN